MTMAEYRNRPLYRPQPLTDDERAAIEAILGGIANAYGVQEPASAGENDAAPRGASTDPAPA